MMNRCCTVFYSERDADLEERGDGGRDMVGWQVSATSLPCLWGETQHNFETWVWCSSKTPPKHQYPSEKIKEVFGLGFLCRTRTDCTQPPPWAASGVTILPQGAVSPRALSPTLGQDCFGVKTCPGGWLPYTMETATADGAGERNDILKAAGGKCDTALEAAGAQL